MATLEKRAFDLVVIGGGTAAISAVTEALQLGAENIALVEKRDRLGGECVLNACVPTKTMLTASRLLKTLRKEVSEYGIETGPLHFDFNKLRRKEESIIQRKVAQSAITHDPRVAVFHEQASFVSRREVRVGDNVIRGDQIIIATGAQPVIPPIQGLDAVGFLLYTQASHLASLPESMIIIGGGPVGVEYAQLFQELGCQVTLVEKSERILKHEEPEISDRITDILRQDDVEIHTDCDIQRAFAQNGKKGINIHCRNEQVVLRAREILAASGMKPRIDGIQLEVAGIEHNDKGIVVDDEMRTTAENIWAVGDVVGPYRFSHVADFQAAIATRNALLNMHQKMDYHAIPWAIYTVPVVAHVGLTEAQARERYRNLVILRASADEVSGFQVESHSQGFIKLLVDGETQQLVGAHLLSSEADVIAQTLVLAMQKRLPLSNIREMMYIFPSKAQIIEKALQQFPKNPAEMAEQVSGYTGGRD